MLIRGGATIPIETELDDSQIILVAVVDLDCAKRFVASWATVHVKLYDVDLSTLFELVLNARFELSWKDDDEITSTITGSGGDTRVASSVSDTELTVFLIFGWNYG